MNTVNDPTVSAPTARVTFFGQSETGKVRQANEDAFLVSDLSGSPPIHTMTSPQALDVKERGVLLAVSDGMGGAKAGDVASALVLYSLRRGMSTVQSTSVEAAFTASVQRANQDVWNASKTSGREGMGATLTAVLFFGQHAYIAEIGDSRAYLVRAGRIFPLTRDQTLVQLLLDRGDFARDQLEDCDFRNVILQAMGTKPNVVVALGRLGLRNEDRLLLCSDGLTRKIADDEILAILQQQPTLEIACQKLVEMAMDRGGDDNITVLLGEVTGDSLARSAGEDRISLEPFQTFSPVIPPPLPAGLGGPAAPVVPAGPAERVDPLAQTAKEPDPRGVVSPPSVAPPPPSVATKNTVGGR